MVSFVESVPQFVPLLQKISSKHKEKTRDLTRFHHTSPVLSLLNIEIPNVKVNATDMMYYGVWEVKGKKKQTDSRERQEIMLSHGDSFILLSYWEEPLLQCIFLFYL